MVEPDEGCHSAAEVGVEPTDVQFSQCLIGPTVAFGRLRDHDQSATAHDGRTDGERRVRWPEASRDHRIDDDRLLSERCRIHAEHADSASPTKSADHAIEEVRPFGAAIDQDHLEIRTVVCDHQTWHAATGPEVDHDTGHVLQRLHEGASVVDDLLDVPFTQEAEPLTFLQDVEYVRIE